MFDPDAEEVSENLLDVFFSIFLRAGSGQALLGEYAFDLEKYNIPHFTDQLTLRLAVKIRTQDVSAGTHDFNPSNLCLVANQLKKNIKSTKRWELLYPFNASQLYVVDEEEPFCWRRACVSTSHPRSQAARV